MQFIYICISLSAVIGCNYAAKFPKELPQCHLNDVKCLPPVMTQIIQNHPHGHSGLSVPVLEPLHINAIDILQGGDSPIAIDLHFKNLDFTGISKAEITKVVGFGRDPDKNKHEVHGRVPKITLYGDYDINGRVLILPIQGVGKATLIFENVDIVVKFKPAMIEKKGKQYMQTSDAFKLDFDMANAQIHFTNLFNGDKALGDNMNLFLNENWRDILKELKPAITYAIEEVLKSIINRIFNKVSYYDMFLDDE